MNILYLVLFCVLNIMTRTVVCDVTISGLSATQGHVHRVCHGTSNGLSMSGTEEQWYTYFRRRYTGCTYVNGNLEITHLSGPDIDLSFLATIEVVTGYVLIVNVKSDVIPLTRLRHIRGDETFHYMTDNALTVLISEVRNGVQLQAIKEITGNVCFYLWSSCYLHTIEWEPFTKGNITYTLWDDKISELDCRDSHCDPACLDTDGERRCWGPGKEMCQIVNRMECSWFCTNGTCFEEGMMGCCHHECLGCYDGWIDTACEYCRHFQFDGHCVPHCPPNTYAHIDTCYSRNELPSPDNNSGW